VEARVQESTAAKCAARTDAVGPKGIVARVVKLFSRRESWALADQGMVSIANFLSGVLVARLVGVREFGVFTLAWASVLFVNSIQSAMITAPMVSVGPFLETQIGPSYYGAVLLQQFVFAAGAAHFKPGWAVGPLALPIAVAVFAYQMQDFMRRYFFATHREKLGFLNDAVSFLPQVLILAILFRSHGATAQIALWVMGLTSLVGFVVGLLTFGSYQFAWGAVRSVTSRHWLSSKWLLGSALMGWTSGNFFLPAAAIVLGPAAAGGVRAAQTLGQVLFVLFNSLENYLPNEAARRLRDHGIGGLKSYLRKTGKAVVSMSAVLCLTIALSGRWLLTVLYGREYGAFAGVLAIMMVTYFLVSAALPARFGLRVLENTGPLFVAQVVGGAFTVATMFPLIAHFGVVGAAWDAFAAQLLMLAIVAVAFMQGLKRKAANSL
jgi:O-antigen/teichoic acid export membrane protein